MVKRRPTDPKGTALRQRGCFNPHPEKVGDEIFEASDFFDPRDLVQVKYEMVRRVRREGRPVGQTAADFGFSRPSFYQAQAALERGGLAALLPRKPGPRRAHKLSEEVIDFLEEALATDAALKATGLAERIKKRYGLTVHPRSIERALARRKKKRPPQNARQKK